MPIFAITYDFSDILPWSKHLGRLAFWAISLIVLVILFLRCALLHLLAAKPSLAHLRVLCTTRMRVFWLVVCGGICLSGYSLVKPDLEFSLQVGLKAIDQKAYPDAIRIYEPLVKWGVPNVEVYNNLAVSYFQVGRYAEAIAAFRQTNERAPQLGFHCHLFCARAFLRSGNPAQAEQELTIARTLAKNPPEQARVNAEWENLKRTVAPVSSPTQPTP